MAPAQLAVFLLGLVVIVVTSVFVAAPLLGSVRTLAPETQPGERERWERQKRQALAAIKELELDHQMGKLSDEDYAALRARFENQALEAMAALERKGRR